MTITYATAAAERGHIGVRYIGREDPFVDRLYGSRLTFAPRQTRLLPAVLAESLLRHSDVFEMVSNEEGQAAEKELVVEDTALRLDEAAKDKEAQNTIVNQRQNLVDEVNLMDKNALKHFAHDKYGQKINGNKSVEALRAEVVQMIDQFGVT